MTGLSHKIKELLRAHGQPPREVYFDLENSGYVPAEVVEAMLPYFNRKGHGHPSITHKPGWEALELVYETKELVANTINHEIGTIQRVKELVNVVKSNNPNAVFHTDVADAYGWLGIDVERLGVDMLTISSHKIHGPRGVGVLYIREGIDLEPPLKGQLSVEKYWPGVENVPLIAGFKKAVEILFRDFENRVNYVKNLRDKLIKGILDSVTDVLINGPLGESRVANNVNVSFLYVEGEALTVELSTYGVYVSSGSACTSRVLEPSHVLLAIGKKHEEAHGSILFKLSYIHRPEDIDYALEAIPKAIERLRKISAWKHWNKQLH